MSNIKLEFKFEGGAALIIFGVILGVIYGQKIWITGELFSFSVFLVFLGIFFLAYNESNIFESFSVAAFFGFIYFMTLLYFTDRGGFDYVMNLIMLAVLGGFVVMGLIWFFGGENR